MLTISVVLVLGILAASTLSLLSWKAPQTGLQAGQLRPCGPRPNCVNSESLANTLPHQTIAPISYAHPDEHVWSHLVESIEELGGDLMHTQGHYLWSTFNTPLMRYVDDLELRLDVKAKEIHMRSASRVGYRDFGVNRKRVDALRAHLQKKLDLSAPVGGAAENLKEEL